MGDARNVGLGRQARQFGLGRQAREIARAGDARNVTLGGVSGEVGAAREFSDLLACCVACEVGSCGKWSQVGALGVFAEVDLSAGGGSGEFFLGGERFDGLRDRFVRSLLRVERGLCHCQPPKVIVSPSSETTPLIVAVSPSPETFTSGVPVWGAGVGVASPENTLSSV